MKGVDCMFGIELTAIIMTLTVMVMILGAMWALASTLLKFLFWPFIELAKLFFGDKEQ